MNMLTFRWLAVLLTCGQFLFMLPLFFQVVLLESASKAGARLVIPSLATPIGSVIAGIVMSRYGKLIAMMRIGSILMAVGNALIFSLRFVDSSWKYFAYIFPANLGQGVVYPSILFMSLASFEHEGTSTLCRTIYLLSFAHHHFRSRGFDIHSLLDSLARWRLGSIHHFRYCANFAQRPSSGCFGRDTR